ncbi:uncharacterized protein LOC143020847 [Oratosquilla oratoria]|uniref:uncharacterized protein LOC143020847 n=1 Tax=Oratosquilla oratoria TaxID=337810 RepID=UPI003F763048
MIVIFVIVVSFVVLVAPVVSAEGRRLNPHGVHVDHGGELDQGVILDHDGTDLGSHVDGRGVPRCPTCPHFLPTKSHVTASVGLMTNLSCGVRNLDNSRVSWIRRSDLHVLTTGSTTYTSDDRFEARHQEGSPYWVLVLRRPVTRDSGVYECQVSTQPKMYRRFTLTVREPRAEIAGASEVFMRAGSDINVTCVVIGAPRGTPIQWYHSLPLPPGTVGENVQLVSEGGRGGVQLVTDKHSGTSWLLVTSATWRDAGTYSCAPQGAHPASITVHVLDQDAPAAMQRDGPSSSSPSTYSPSTTSSSTATLIFLATSPLFLGGCGSCTATRVAAVAVAAVVAVCVDLLRGFVKAAEDYLPKMKSSLRPLVSCSPASVPTPAENISTPVLFTRTDVTGTENIITDFTSTGDLVNRSFTSTGNRIPTDFTSTGNMIQTEFTLTGNSVQEVFPSTGNIVQTDFTSTGTRVQRGLTSTGNMNQTDVGSTIGTITVPDIITTTTPPKTTTTSTITIPDTTTKTDLTTATDTTTPTDADTEVSSATTGNVNPVVGETTVYIRSTITTTGGVRGPSGYGNPQQSHQAVDRPSTAQPGCGGV